MATATVESPKEIRSITPLTAASGSGSGRRLMGLTHDPPTIVEGVHAERVFCAALSLASPGAVMVLLNVWHPPAGATTLIIALGIITRPYHLLIVEAAVAILVLQALIINRLAGIEYPVWARAVPVGQREPIAAEGRPEDENLHRTKRCT